MKTALITGVTGQDGSYLAELLLEKGYRVVGIYRRVSVPTTQRIDHLKEKLIMVPGDLMDAASLGRAVSEYRPDEVYNLAAQSFVETSFVEPTLTSEVTAIGALRLLEVVHALVPDARFYQASSSEMFGKVAEVPQTERTPFYPRSPYGAAKCFAHWVTVNYRESYGMYACSGILFNHESPRRGLEFVTRKVTRAVAEIAAGRRETVSLGNLEARRDWGFAGDYVEAMWLMLQRDMPVDYVIATGETHSVRELVELAFQCAGLNWRDHVRVDERLIRPAEVDVLMGDPLRAEIELGWRPTVKFDELVHMMVAADRQSVGLECQ